MSVWQGISAFDGGHLDVSRCFCRLLWLSTWSGELKFMMELNVCFHCTSGFATQEGSSPSDQILPALRALMYCVIVTLYSCKRLHNSVFCANANGEQEGCSNKETTASSPASSKFAWTRTKESQHNNSSTGSSEANFI